VAVITCPRCKTDNPDDRSNCQKCGLNIQPINRLVFRLMQLVALMFILALSVGGIAMMYMQPLSILTCRYVEAKQVNCQIQERIAWLIPVRRSPFTNLKEAYVKPETQIRKDEDGDEYNVTVYRVVLTSDSSEIVLKGTDEIRLTSDLTARRINDYLNVATGEGLTVWGYGLWAHTLITLAGGGVFLLFGFCFVMAIVDMVFGPSTVAKLLRVKRESGQED
jgi:hypothetical protein